MTLYFDTSALVKLILVEDGSELASELWSGDCPRFSSILSYPEGRSALAAARRHGRLRVPDYREVLATFEALQEELITVGIDDDLARTAGRHAEELGLRGYDAVHIATALEVGDEEVVVVTWDNDLARAAERVGLGVAGAIA